MTMNRTADSERRGGGRLGILVGGGPSPGINSVISAAAIEGANSGLEVIGIHKGFHHLVSGNAETQPLPIEDVSRIHTQGGSILGTSRTNPTRTEEHLQTTVDTLADLKIDRLITIGGDDTAFSAYEVAKAGRGSIRVAHIPKTIDNDLPLPGNMPTFGFETARHLGTQLVLNLMEDARTTNRWYYVVTMGRKTGHLALGMGKAAGSTLTVIPEEFPEDTIRLDDLCDLLEGAMLKRKVMGRDDGVAVVAEGVAEKIDPEELAQLPGVYVSYDPHGHIRLDQIPLATILSRRVRRRFAERGEDVAIVDATLGYELRSAAPIPFDIDYTRTLGYGAVRFLLSAPEEDRLQLGGMVCLQDGRGKVVPFEDFRDSTTGRTQVRYVDVTSLHYKVARDYMIRLESDDLERPDMLESLARVGRTTPEQFKSRFASAARRPGG
ncbi:MAG: diphosphate--fructose-6-phosphate 1-phosphotransferase [Chloroflexi bacterium]|nr:diphosphate--fructose-6-phosphate 1-phosphotransferase [Chloroflexota bacterium]